MYSGAPRSSIARSHRGGLGAQQHPGVLGRESVSCSEREGCSASAFSASKFSQEDLPRGLGDLPADPDEEVLDPLGEGPQRVRGAARPTVRRQRHVDGLVSAASSALCASDWRAAVLLLHPVPCPGRRACWRRRFGPGQAPMARFAEVSTLASLTCSMRTCLRAAVSGAAAIAASAASTAAVIDCSSIEGLPGAGDVSDTGFAFVLRPEMRAPGRGAPRTILGEAAPPGRRAGSGPHVPLTPGNRTTHPARHG